MQYNRAVTIIPYNFGQLTKDIASLYGVSSIVGRPELVCDYELLLYSIRRNKEPLIGADFIGFADIDVIYGNIWSFLPDNPEQYSMISAHDNRPCGPLTLFNSRFFERICHNHKIRNRILSEHAYYASMQESFSSDSYFSPITGTRKKDMLAREISFEHLDESEDLMKIAEKYAPVFCASDPLQPTMTNGFNHRKTFALWESGKLKVYDNRMHKKEGAIFHFSRFKKRDRFKWNDSIVSSDRFGIYKYGIIEVKNITDLARMYFSVFF